MIKIPMFQTRIFLSGEIKVLPWLTEESWVEIIPLKKEEKSSNIVPYMHITDNCNVVGEILMDQTSSHYWYFSHPVTQSKVTCIIEKFTISFTKYCNIHKCEHSIKASTNVVFLFNQRSSIKTFFIIDLLWNGICISQYSNTFFTLSLSVSWIVREARLSVI